MSEKPGGTKPKSNWRRVLLALAIVLVLVMVIILPGASILVYEDTFGKRYNTPGWMRYALADFPGLRMKRCVFRSKDGKKLAGYQYSRENPNQPGDKAEGLVVIAHGFGGGGQNTYMDVANYFTSQGFLVFAYDATGNDESAGKSVMGLPQGVEDLDQALRFVEGEQSYKGLPLFLFGQSWGGYAVGAVLNLHPEVKAAVMVSGFNRSIDMMRQPGRKIAGPAVSLILPCLGLYEHVKFGKFAGYTALDGLKKSKAGIFITQSRDDQVVPVRYSYDLFHETFQSNPRFRFREYQDRGHAYVYYSQDSVRYRKQFDQEYKEHMRRLGQKPSNESYNAYSAKHFDKSRGFELDVPLMNQMADFYRQYMD